MSSLMAIGLAACGSSSSSPTTATQANAAATSTTGAAAGNGATGATSAVGATGTHRNSPARVSAVRNCLQRNGIKLPAGGSARGLFLGGGLPKGATATQLRAAMRKCLGGTGPLGRAAGGHFLRTGNPRFKQALAGFASCMRKNGVNVPSPNTSGKGPVFSTKGLNTESAQFKAAAAKCRPLLSAGFRRPAGAAAQPTG
ncbi:MAG TPA: hypothetical protein VFW38_13135 [Solirubrobacteraceae bacterium]|nr:hypothetical protein [Solirubrobacteraceae bacterium]